MEVFATRIVSPRYSPPYPVVIGKGLVNNLSSLVRRYTRLEPNKCLVVYPEPLQSVASKASESLRGLCSDVIPAALPDSEAAKSLETVLQLVELMHEYNFSRRDLVVVIGGGAASDAAGFAAAVYKRGVPYINAPTTLLAMVDAAIGGKTAVNYKGLKNVIGAFHQPRMVVEDVELLSTLPALEWLSGLGEIVKYAFTLSERIYRVLREHGTRVLRDENILQSIIHDSVDAKARIVELDEREEHGVREILNFGHTVGHAIEEALMGKVKHGVAVAWGCVLEAWVGVRLGLTPEYVAREVEKLVVELGFPELEIPSYERLAELVKRDKKVHGNKIRGVFTLAPGRGIVAEVGLDEYLEALKWSLRRLGKG